MTPDMMIRYEIPRADLSAIDMPVGAVPCKVMAEGKDIVLYVRANPGRELERRWFTLKGTLDPLESCHYIDSVSLMGDAGAVVIHVFEALRVLH